MISDWRSIPSAGEYGDALYEFLINLETADHQNPDYQAYIDSRGNLSIGVGFNLNDPAVRASVFAALGLITDDPKLVNSPALNTAENSYIAGLTAAIQNRDESAFNDIMQARANDANLAAVLGPQTWPLDDASVTQAFQAIVGGFEADIDTWLPGIPMSSERIALVSLAYNSRINAATGLPTILGPGLRSAIESGNRAAAWYEIRYGSNPLSPDSRGIAKRRYYEAQEFSLYADPANPTALEVLQAYQVLSQHRTTIQAYEQLYGDQVSAANNDYGLTGTGAEVQTLAQSYDAAAKAEILALGGALYASGLPLIVLDDSGGTGQTTFDIRSVDILAASSARPNIDAGNQAFGPDDNHILIAADDDEKLTGGSGNDILIAQGAQDTLVAGRGGDTLIADGGSDTLRFSGNADVLDFVMLGPVAGYKETVIDNSPLGGQFLDVNGTQLGTGLSPVAGQAYTWSDGQNTYRFIKNPTNPPEGYSPIANAEGVGELQILLGDLNGQPGQYNEIDIWGFNLGAADTRGASFLGIAMPTPPQATAGANAGVDPPAPDFVAGSSQSYTVWLDAPAETAQTITMTLSGAPGSDFVFDTGSGTQALNDDGTFSLTIPEGQTSVSFALTNTVDVGASASLVLTPSISDPADPGAGSLSGDPVTQNYIEPTQDPFATPTVGTLYYQGPRGMANGDTYSWYTDVPSDTPAGGLISGNNLIQLLNGGVPNDSIDGGAGNDTITADFGFRQADGGVDVINGNGGQDVITVPYVQTPYQWVGTDTTAPDGPASVRVYGNSQVSLEAAIAAANGATATGEQGDLIFSNAASSTLVGGDGNDLILDSGDGVLVAGPGDDTLVSGAHWSAASGSIFTGPPPGVDWSTTFTGNHLSVDGGDFFYLDVDSQGDPIEIAPPSGYEGNVDDAGTMLGDSNNTIFGGAGNDVIILSNGDNEIHLGNGNSTVLGGMGDNTIEGGAGADSILAGGGSDYIAAGSGNDLIIGRAGNNTIIGGSGNDTLFAGDGTTGWATLETGNNYVQAGSGNTQIAGSGGSDTLLGGAGNDSIAAGDGAEYVVGGTGNELIVGGAGNDTLMAGGDGNDSILAGSGNTTIYGGGGTDILQGGAGVDVIYAGDGGTTDAPTQVIAGSGDTTIYGGEGRDLIAGGDGNDVIYAGDGGTADGRTQVIAGSGNTTVYGGDGVDQIFGGSGTDVLYAGDGGIDDAATFVTAGTGAATLYGGAGASVLRDSLGGGDLLVAGSGDASLFGIGNDTLVAGSGEDYLSGTQGVTYVIGSEAGSVEIASDSGAGIVQFASDIDPTTIAATAVLGPDGGPALELDTESGSVLLDDALGTAQSDSVALGSAAPISLGAWLKQVEAADNLSGSSGTNGNLLVDATDRGSAVAGDGQDTIAAWGDNETLTAGAGGTQIFAYGTDNLAQGGSGNDTLAAFGTGTTLIGGGGSDLFEVNDVTDVVQEQAGGSDSIESSVSYTLPTAVDFLTLTGSSNLTATGNNDEFNVITGNSGNDSLIAGSGSDNLISGSGVDTLVGGTGTDQFYINNSADVIQGSSSIRDAVYSSVSYVLNAPVALLTLTGTGNLSATNQSGATIITGNAGNDTLSAGTGADTLVAGSGIDTLVAGSGNDTFVVNSSADVIQASAAHGQDTVESSASYTLAQYVDTLTLTGAGNLTGTGNSDAANLITGNAGNDTLIAGSGNDTLVAGNGIDTLIAGSGSDVLRGANGDTYQLNPGFGQAEMITPSGSATLRLGTGVDPADLSFGMTLGSDGKPALLIQEGSGSVTVDGGLTGTINSVVLADGTPLTLAQLLAEGNSVSSTIVGANGNLVFDATASDSLIGGAGDDTLIGAFGGDTLVGGIGNQQIYGIGSGDLLVGGAGQDTLYGESSGDTFVGGTGDTQVYAGPGSNYYALTQGATLTIDQSDSQSLQTLILPDGMTASDFTSYTDSNGDLVVQSLSGDTTAIIKGLYDSATLWTLEDSNGGQSLRGWASSAAPQQTPDAYRHEIDLLREQYSVQMGALLNGLGKSEESIVSPGSPSTANEFTFTGVATQNIAGDGFIQVGPSQSDVVQTYTTQQTVTTTYYEPIYQTTTTPAVDYFEPNTSGTTDLFSGEPTDSPYVSTIYNDDGSIRGWDIHTPAETNTVQTGTRAVTESYTIDAQQRNETLGFTAYNIKLGDQDDTLEATAPFVGTVQMGNGNDLVDLGLDNSPDVKTIFGFPTYFSGQLSPGAFIEAGSGNDTIYGTGGADTIAAGLGIDSLTGATGTTFYVPLEGDSTDYINTEFAPHYGSGPYPHNTLVLPTGVTPEDLQLRVMDDPGQTDGPNSKILQIRYGDSTVIAYFDASFPFPFDAQHYDTEGLNYFQFSDGTVLTRDQVLAMATQATDDSAPVVSAENQTLTAEQAEQPVSAAAFFSGSGTTDNPVIWYQVTNTGGLGGYFVLGGQVQLAGRPFYVDAGQLDQLSYVGAAGTEDTVEVRAFDGLSLSAPTSFSIGVESNGDGVTVATGPDQTVYGTSDPTTLRGGYDGDTLVGGSGDDTFLYNSGGGAETILQEGSGSSSVLDLGAGITPSSLTLTADPNAGDLILGMGGGDSLSIVGFDVWNPLQTGSMQLQAINFADGTSLTPLQLIEDAQAGGSSSISVDNGDGTYSKFIFSPGAPDFYTALTTDTSGKLVSQTAYDRNNTSTELDYQNGSVTATTVSEFDAQGDWTGSQTTNADGSSDDWSYTSNPDGSFSQTEVYTPAQGTAETWVYSYSVQGWLMSVDGSNVEGSGGTDDTTYTYNANGTTSTTTEVVTPGDGGPPTTTFTQYDPGDGSTLQQNAYTPSPDGSYTDTWSHQDGSGGTYWWQTSTLEYQQNWTDSDGTTWTDDYQYTAGGSPGSTGVSFTETYTDSAGDQGTREYDASTGVASLSWYSSSTDTTVTGTTADAGFIGLQNDGELTNAQPDLTFFNPNVSPSFSAFLAGH